jgi:4-aminobutyrate aminotransferase
VRIQAVPAGLDDRPVPDLITEIPGPKARAHVIFDETWTSPSLPRAYPIVPVRGRGMAIEDIDGNLFLDFAAGIAVNSTGHGHPQVVGAIKEQASELIHYSASDFYLPIYAETAKAIARIAPMSGRLRTYLGNSGTEMVETAMKLARHATGRPYIVGFLGGFHGRTYGAVSLTASKAKYHARFDPLLPGIYHAPFGHVEDLKWFDDVLFERLIPANEVAAIVIEPIQGEGGYTPAPVAFLAELRAFCDRHGILLIADEVQTGYARTGRMWAFEHAGIVPDVVCMAKAIANGLPLSAIISSRDLQTRWGRGAHGSTFGGNPVACAAGLAVLETIHEDGLVANAAARGAELVAGLGKIAAEDDRIGDIRGRGLMVGVEFVRDRATREPDATLPDRLMAACADAGLLVLTCGSNHQVVRWIPPLDVDAAEIAEGIEIFGEALAGLPRD